MIAAPGFQRQPMHQRQPVAVGQAQIDEADIGRGAFQRGLELGRAARRWRCETRPLPARRTASRGSRGSSSRMATWGGSVRSCGLRRRQEGGQIVGGRRVWPGPASGARRRAAGRRGGSEVISARRAPAARASRSGQIDAGHRARARMSDSTSRCPAGRPGPAPRPRDAASITGWPRSRQHGRARRRGYRRCPRPAAPAAGAPGHRRGAAAGAGSPRRRRSRVGEPHRAARQLGAGHRPSTGQAPSLRRPWW